MSYLVLARKWRPTRFEDVVGQEHVVRALRNALDTGRVHHAFLFAGSRGTGKTTLARIVARCLNCEAGAGAHPCGACSACREIDQGRFIDLIEVDAASRTKVDDTRELLDNVQYAPTRGRYKVYLIDEVHMLSGHSFNALLKTLEEPPAHVKFLLATTDPQKVPATVLSRCLQFNLKRLVPGLIRDRLGRVLEAEGIESEPEAIAAIADAADGSLRDALSLLDQAIAYGNGEVRAHPVREMLGTIDHKVIVAIIEALATGHPEAALAAVSDASMFDADYGDLLRALLLALHDIAVAQQLGGPSETGRDIGPLQDYVTRLAPEDVQLFYQIGAMGRRDLPFAPDERVGLEMTLLRMIAFRPAAPVYSGATQVSATAPLPADALPRAEPGNATGAGTGEPLTDLVAHWDTLAGTLAASGIAREILTHSTARVDGAGLVLAVDPACGRLADSARESMIASAIKQHLGRPIEVRLEVSSVEQDTPARIQRAEQEARIRSASATIMNDPAVRELQDQFGARINPASIKPKV
ncbi:MAG: DNA polymerase III subunit gamma/tau [Acidiferrobacteraceae bacterium]